MIEMIEEVAVKFTELVVRFVTATERIADAMESRGPLSPKPEEQTIPTQKPVETKTQETKGAGDGYESMKHPELKALWQARYPDKEIKAGTKGSTIIKWLRTDDMIKAKSQPVEPVETQVEPETEQVKPDANPFKTTTTEIKQPSTSDLPADPVAARAFMKERMTEFSKTHKDGIMKMVAIINKTGEAKMFDQVADDKLAAVWEEFKKLEGANG